MNIFYRTLTLVLGFSLFSLTGCTTADGEEQKINSPVSQQFSDYWYSGKAELTHYKLEQARYGEIHEGNAVLIFVTEDFLTDKQVKYEFGERGENVESVLKLNFTRKFFTGIYPYSLISSVFTPVNPSKPTLKVTTSSQEWCGHTFSQLNLREDKYTGHLYSYFQAEGDQDFSLQKALLEDELWAKIRLDPSLLPTGEIELIPGTQSLRFKHRKIQVERAGASLHSVQDSTLSSKPLTRYQIAYEDFERVLEITFEDDFPHTIVAWEEQMVSGFGDPKLLTTRAVRTLSLNSPYWSQNSVADSVYRKELGL